MRTASRRRRSSRRPASRRTAQLIDSEAQRLGHVGSWQWDALRDEVTWSHELYRIYGLKPGEFSGTYEAFLRHVHPDDQAFTREVIGKAFREGKPFAYDHRIVRPDGEVRMLQTRGDVVPGPGGKVVRMVGCCLDVTEQWRTRRELDESTALLRATLEATHDGVFVVDLSGKVVLINRRALELWRVPETLAARGDLQALIDYGAEQVDDPAAFRARENELSSRPELSGTDTVRCKDGRVFERHTRPQRLKGAVVGRVCSFRDVTARERALSGLKRLAAELEARVRRRTQDLERSNADLDAFACTASHDLNAPLRKINAYAQLLQSRAAGKLDAEERGLLDRIAKSISTMTVLIADLLALSRASREPLTAEDVDLNAVLAESISDAEPALAATGGKIEAGPLPRTRSRASLWRRLFNNLIGNALKFRAPDRAPVIVVRSRRDQDGSAVISVRDNGIGFDPKYSRDIFLPFRRLNPVSSFEGSGLGLAICARIVDRFDGEIWAESEPGKGSTFFVKLPAASVRA